MIPAPDGYQYGVMFTDGSVHRSFNGRTSRERATDLAERYWQRYPTAKITLARRLPPDGAWERICPYSGLPVTQCKSPQGPINEALGTPLCDCFEFPEFDEVTP